MFFFFFKMYFISIGKSNIQRGETERKIFHPMIHSPSSRNDWCCADLKPGAKKLLQISYMGAGSQGFGPALTAFPGHKQGAGWEVGLLGLEQAPIWDPIKDLART